MLCKIKHGNITHMLQKRTRVQILIKPFEVSCKVQKNKTRVVIFLTCFPICPLKVLSSPIVNLSEKKNYNKFPVCTLKIHFEKNTQKFSKAVHSKKNLQHIVTNANLPEQ